MSSVFAVVSIESSYGADSVVAVCAFEAEAEEMCKRLNAARLIRVSSDYEVVEFSLGALPEDQVEGFKASYDFALHGFSVEVADVVVEEIIFSPERAGRVTFDRNMVTVWGVSREECLRILSDAMAVKSAKNGYIS